MKLILFQLLTNCTIGSIVRVTFDDKLFKVINVWYNPTWKNPFHFNVNLINQFGGFEFCGHKCISSDIFKDKRMYHEIEEIYRKFNLSK